MWQSVLVKRIVANWPNWANQILYYYFEFNIKIIFGQFYIKVDTDSKLANLVSTMSIG